MNDFEYWKAIVVWIGIAVIEVGHGILRARFLARKVGDLRSRQIGVFSGSLLIFLIAYLSFDWLQLQSVKQAILAGVIWFVLMFCFEMLLGHYVFKFTWKWLLADFNFFKGRLLLFGMLFLMLTPWLIGKLRGQW